MTSNWEYATRILPYVLPIVVGLTYFLVNKNTLEAAIWSGLVVWGIIGLIVAGIVHEKVFSETATSGLLRPASEPTPPTPCSSIPKDAIILLLGDSASWTTASHHTVLKVDGEDLLSIDRKNSGIAVSAKIYSRDRKLVAEIIDNEFNINPSNYFRRERPDRHTLVVFDQQGQRVLYVRHINSSAIKVLGTFYSARNIVRINENEVMLPNNTRLSRFCFGNNMVSIAVN